MKRIACLAAAAGLVALAGCGGDRTDQPTATADNFVPPVTRAPTPVAGQAHTTPLTAYVGHYPRDAVDGVSFFDRTEVANTLVELEPDDKMRRLVVGRDATTVPIFAMGQRIAAHGCEPHNCGGRNWTVVIAADGNRDRAAICLHDDATAPDTSRWTTRAGTQQRPGDCPQG
ncbi:MAG: hypothetical protein EOP67_57535 [Sphingomonas sp.]|nr:MAG: hypothetical protein EOP67_57535 [Sphingomonas sp.]